MLGKFVDRFNYTCNDARRILRTLLTKYIYSYSDIVIILCFLFQFLRFQRSFFSRRINAWFFLLYILIIFFWLSLLAAYFRRLHLSDVILKKKEKQQKQQKDAMKWEGERKKKITFDFYENEYMHGHEVMIKFHSFLIFFCTF